MRKRINSTGRKKIPLDTLVLRLERPANDDTARFTAELTGIASLGLDPAANVYVEPYLGSSSMRFPFGTVGNLRHPEDTRLDELDVGDGIRFRVMVVDESGDLGRLLGLAEVEPEDENQDDNDREAILPLKLRDLGERVWMIDMDDIRPSLVLNRRIPNVHESLLTSPMMQGMIFPAVLEKILPAAFAETDEDVDWARDWREYAEALIAEEILDDLDESANDEVVKKVVEAFVSQGQYATKIQMREAGTNADV